MEEQWRLIPGFKDYEISDQGNARSTKRGVTRLLTRNINPAWGNVAFNLYTENGPRSLTACKAVCLAWHGPANGLRARHISGDILDDRPSNVRWG